VGNCMKLSPFEKVLVADLVKKLSAHVQFPGHKVSPLDPIRGDRLVQSTSYRTSLRFVLIL
jgi:hypothetical protein